VNEDGSQDVVLETMYPIHQTGNQIYRYLLQTRKRIRDTGYSNYKRLNIYFFILQQFKEPVWIVFIVKSTIF
jgi:hypothetical protein